MQSAEGDENGAEDDDQDAAPQADVSRLLEVLAGQGRRVVLVAQPEPEKDGEADAGHDEQIAEKQRLGDHGQVLAGNLLVVTGFSVRTWH